MTAKLGQPPKRATLGPPPKPEEVQGNLVPQHKKDLPVRQLNVRVSPEKHEEIKIAAIKAKKSMGEYLIELHDRSYNGGA
jgi:predicted HicB family RNase H-like nuclease